MKLLIIDPGHGGSEPGAVAYGYKEKDLNLIVARRVSELLKDYHPDMTRTDDVTLSLADRGTIISGKYEYCLSIHFNASGSNAQGIEAIYSLFSTTGKMLADSIAKSLKESLNIPIRRTFYRKGKDGRDYYAMHRNTGKTVTVIVESLFMDSPDIKHLNIESIAQGIAFGFRSFLGGGLTLTDTAEYDKVATTDVAYIDPDALYGEIVKRKGTDIRGDFVNGTFYDMSSMRGLGNLISNGKVLCKQWITHPDTGKPHDNVKRANLIVYTDGTVKVKLIMDIEAEENISNIKFAVSGFNLFPLDLSAEWWPQGIGRADWRTAIGYNPAKDKIVIAIRPDSTAQRAVQTMRNLGCTMAIGLDSGLSTNARFGKDIRLTDRVLHNIIRW